MYIKNIKMQGFKSFADKTEIDFSKGISAIVGPNGSGKSNVVDAILWVLGEQSVKTLRGDGAMSEVIFSGSKSRDEQKKASVAILFDNTDKRLNTELNEIEIKRVIYSTGENEYYINNVKVRLKDITDLLIDVTSKFNIISQGNISALVENKSSERRTLFESAAGVLKYKKRKEESLRKLDATKENLTRVNLIIKELETTIEPLEKQKEDALKYLSIKENLEKIEIALIASDITNYKTKHDTLVKQNEENQTKIDSKEVSKADTLERLKLDNTKLQEDIETSNNELITINTELAKLTSEKQITLERSKYSLDKKTVDQNLLSLKELSLNYEKNVKVLEEELNTLKEDLKVIVSDYNSKSDEELKSKINVTNLTNDINKLKSDILDLQNKIKIEKANLENNAFMPKSVSSVLNNPILSGIHNTISGVIDINESHYIAIQTALGASSNFIIVDNLSSAKKAINFLKDGRLGRATFFPIDVIKSRKLPQEVEYTISNNKGYIGIASDLVSYDKKYQNIIENQLGNVIVVDTIDDLENMAKNTDYKYRIVTLEGEVLFPGGSIAGGINKNSNDKALLNKLTKSLEEKESLLNDKEVLFKEENTKNEMLVSSCESLNKDITEKRHIIELKEASLKEEQKHLDDANNEIKGLKDINNNEVDKALDKLLKDISNKEKDKEILEGKIKDLQSKKFDLASKIEDEENRLRKQNSEYNQILSDIQKNEVEIGKFEVKIENLLNTLSEEYNMTYENAKDNYELSIEESLARSSVNKYKSELKGLTNINLGSINEYDRLKKRYDFLDKQRTDLEGSSSELLKMIDEMDEIMKEKFKKTFDKVATEFSKVFRVMFKGGNGLLKLEDADDLLNTGINILAVPPGKKLNSTAALSGGEKALTAICLIFAILNVNPVPFIILDEAEAPLDEENVNMFGEYLSNIKEDNQFILITHKKKMMEYADVLYGITMQEKGVSKLVSVKLEDN